MVLDGRCEEFLTFPGPLLTGISLYPNDGAVTSAIRQLAHGDVSPKWLSKGTSFFRSNARGSGTNRTLRTEVTVERQGRALLGGGLRYLPALRAEAGGRQAGNTCLSSGGFGFAGSRAR